MIFGTGIDIIEVKRIERSLTRGDGLKNKLFTRFEQDYCDNRRAAVYQCYAARFAVKEAFFKALGTGYRYGMAFTEIEVKNDKLGKPFVEPSGKVKEFIEENGVKKIHISISHVKETAVASVILEK